MKHLFYLLIIIFLSENYYSQADTLNSYKPPSFVGGTNAYKAYMDKYFMYPASERERGPVSLNYTATIYIAKEGKVKFVNIVGSDNEIKTQLKRILTLMPDWSGAQINRAPIDTFVTQKIYISIDKSRAKNDSTVYEYIFSMRPMTEEELAKSRKERSERLVNYTLARDFFDRGIVEFKNNNYKDAIALFSDAKKNQMESTDLFFNLGAAYLKLGDVENACPNFREAARKGDQEAFGLYIKLCK